MDILRHLVPAYQVADATGGPAPGTAEPEPGGTPASTAVPPAAAVDPALAPDETIPFKKFVDTVTPLRARAREAEERAARVERELRAANELLARQQRPPADPAASTAAPAVTSPAATTPASAPDFQAAVRAEAAQQRLVEDVASINLAGQRQFGQVWNERVNALASYGADTYDFMADVLAADRSNAHVMLDEIARRPELGMSLAAMPSRQRIAELAKMSAARTATASTVEPDKTAAAVPPARGISKTPPPAPAIEPSSTTVTDWRSDKVSDEEFSKGWEENQKTRRRVR